MTTSALFRTGACRPPAELTPKDCIDMDQYEILSLIGHGTYGKVYKIRHKQEQTLLVLKTLPFDELPREEQQDALNEVEVMKQVDHPSFIRFYDAFQSDGSLHIIMEHADGGDLAHLLEHRQNKGMNPFPEHTLWQYLLQICEGLAYLHEKRILHRDLKPQNIFLASSGRIKIGDFGLGRILGPKTMLARSGVGTPLYFAPELCEDKPYDDKADVWALGCLMYELATFLPPFVASNQIALAKKIVSEAHDPLPQFLSEEFRFLVGKMLTKSAAHRPSIKQILKYSPMQQLMNERDMKAALDQQAEHYEAHIEALEQQLRDHKATIQAQEQTITAFKAKEEEGQAKLHQRVNELQAKLTVSLRTNEQLNARLHATNQLYHEAEALAREVAGRADELERHYTQLRKDKSLVENDLRAQLQLKSTHVASLEAELEDLRQLTSVFEKEVLSMEAEQSSSIVSRDSSVASFALLDSADALPSLPLGDNDISATHSAYHTPRSSPLRQTLYSSPELAPHSAEPECPRRTGAQLGLARPDASQQFSVLFSWTQPAQPAAKHKRPARGAVSAKRVQPGAWSQPQTQTHSLFRPTRSFIVLFQAPIRVNQASKRVQWLFDVPITSTGNRLVQSFQLQLQCRDHRLCREGVKLTHLHVLEYSRDLLALASSPSVRLKGARPRTSRKASGRSALAPQEVNVPRSAPGAHKPLRATPSPLKLGKAKVAQLLQEAYLDEMRELNESLGSSF